MPAAGNRGHDKIYNLTRGDLAEVEWAMTEGWVGQVGDRREGTCGPLRAAATDRLSR
jgi:hypothetical protein